jgi:hypothetical protein
VGEELAAYQAHFAPLFARREQREWAAVYLRGLLLADVPRKNVEAMTLRLFGAGPDAARQVRALQQFIGEGAWEDDVILAEHQRFVAQTMGEEDGVLILDGSDVPKRGVHSAGAAPQWCGATGKTDTCQAGVFLGYASRQGSTLLDRRLFLPEAWFEADHAARWQACRIPGEVRFQTKAELGAAMVERLQARGELPATWLVCDVAGVRRMVWTQSGAVGPHRCGWVVVSSGDSSHYPGLATARADGRATGPPTPTRLAPATGCLGPWAQGEPCAPAPGQPARRAGGDAGSSVGAPPVAALPDPGGAQRTDRR